MPSQTRSQTSFREERAASKAPPSLALHLDDEIRHDYTDGNNVRLASGMRMRQDASTQFAPLPAESEAVSLKDADARSTTSSSRRRRRNESDEPPRFVVDLSLPPEQRYLAVCAAFQDEIAKLVPLFDEVVGGMLPKIPLKWLHLACRLLLRGVYDKEENAELNGISKATGVSMYLLVAFNVLLDLFMGCSSGGAAVRDPNHDGTKDGKDGGSKMVHFRTLDWGMPSLRKVVVQLDFVSEKDGPVFASSITYAGYVGVLTGVRKGVSMSLNFRPNRIDNGVFMSDIKYIYHLLCVLLGWRRSISSTIRGFLLPRRKKSWLPFVKAKQDSVGKLPSYETIVNSMGPDTKAEKPPIKTTACYFTICSGQETTVIEKDRISAKARTGDEFIVVTNTDESPPTTQAAPPPTNSSPDEKTMTTTAAAGTNPTTTPSPGDELAEIISEAQDRQECALHNWRSLQTSLARKAGLSHITSEQRKRLASVEDVVELAQKYPTTNECTHFACVMDPGGFDTDEDADRDGEGKGVVWCQRWKDPVGAKWIRAHMSATW